MAHLEKNKWRYYDGNYDVIKYGGCPEAEVVKSRTILISISSPATVLLLYSDCFTARLEELLPTCA